MVGLNNKEWVRSSIFYMKIPGLNNKWSKINQGVSEGGGMDVLMQGVREQLSNCQHRTEIKLYLKTSQRGVSSWCSSSFKHRDLFLDFVLKDSLLPRKSCPWPKKGLLMEKLWCFSSDLVWWVEKVRKGRNKNGMALNISSDAGWMQIEAGLWKRAAVWGTELPFSAPVFHPFPSHQCWSSSCWSLPACIMWRAG